MGEGGEEVKRGRREEGIGGERVEGGGKDRIRGEQNGRIMILLFSSILFLF